MTTTVTTTTTATARDRARAAAASVLDPELPVITIAELGILRDVEVGDDGTVFVTVTPTYSGCPATEVIRADVEAAVRSAGFDRVDVRTVLAPAWTTDWITEAGLAALHEHGVAPPSGTRPAGSVTVALSVRCPHCGSLDTRETSRFGSTACQSLRVCSACLEPFGHLKAI